MQEHDRRRARARRADPRVLETDLAAAPVASRASVAASACTASAHARSRCACSRSRSRSRKRWILPVAVFGSSSMNSIAARVLVRRELVLDEGLELRVARRRCPASARRRPWSWSGRRRRSCRSPRLEHRRVLHQRRLDLERRDVDAARPSACRRCGRRRCSSRRRRATYLSPLFVHSPWNVSRDFVAVAPVHQRRARAADVEVADLAVGDRAAVVAAQLDLVAGRPACRWCRSARRRAGSTGRCAASRSSRCRR